LARFADHWRTSAFRLSLLYGCVFVIAVLALLGLIYWRTAGYMILQNDEVIDLELHAFQKLDAAALRERIAHEMDRDIRHINVYGLFDHDGNQIAGNLVSAPPGLPEDGTVHRLRDARLGEPWQALPQLRGAALLLGSGELLVVGRDVAPLIEIRAIILRALALVGSLTLLAGIGAAGLLSVSPLRRIGAIKSASERVVRGDVTARLPIAGRHDELDMLAGIVNSMLDEIERLLSEVKSVCDGIAHDLRTPLTRLRARIYRLQQDLDQQPRHQVAAEQAVAETDALLARFHALLRISEIEDGQRRGGFGDVALEDIVGQTVELYEPMAEERSVHLIYDARARPRVHGDGELLFEAINNLVDNAIKFSPAGGSVRIELDEDARGARIDIVDSGPGIPPQEREAVLQRFYRGEGTREAPGSGLGLSIVSAIVRLHRFELELAEAGGGTRVTLRCAPPNIGG
jgi:signal transduction histidine kinase